MEEIKNPFSFGTGNIDKDQWLRDIDNEQEDFITRYGSATNKHRTALLRQAFQDLRARIASGDMLNRTADGLYQFGSALNRDDKHMLEAYQRALGFMGNLARRQISTPVKPEEKKYGTTTLLLNWLKYLNPSGKFNEKAYWAEGDDASRIAELKKFLEQEKNGLGAYTEYEGYKDRADLEGRIQAFLDSPTERNLQRLGFDNRNWITKPVEEVPEEEPKSELQQVQEQIAVQLEALKVQLGRLYLNWESNKGNPQSWGFETKPYDYLGMFNYNRKNGNIKLSNYTPLHNFGNFSFTNSLNTENEKTNQLRLAFDLNNINLMSLYLKDLGVNYGLMAENSSARLGAMLGLLQTLFNIGDKTASPYAALLKLYLTPMLNGAYLINGSANKNTGRYAFYTPSLLGTYSPGIHEVSILDLDDPVARQALGAVQANKEGGKINSFQAGGEISNEEWSNYLNKVEPKVSKSEEYKELPKQNNREMSTADYAAIGADIGSIIASFIPGYGTAASLVLGVGSTLSNFVSDMNDENTSLGDALWNGAKGLGADTVGLIPGFGASAKGWKIATRLAKYGTGIMAGLSTMDAFNNSPEMMKSFKKVLSLKVNDMDLLDWRNVLNGLSMLATASRAGHGVAVHKGYKGQLKVTNPKKPEVTVEPKTRTEKAKAKIGEFRDKFKGKGDIYDYGGPNNLPWYHDANIYLWGANRSGFNMGLKNPYKVDMSSHMKGYGPKKVNTPLSLQLQNSPMPSAINDTKITPLLNVKAPNYRNRNIESVNKGTKKAVYVKRIGGILKALRNGGIIKAQLGLSSKYTVGDLDDDNPMGSWGNLNWGTTQNNSFKDYLTAGYNQRNGITWSRGLWGTADSDLDMFSAYNAQRNYYTQNDGNNIMGDVKNYFSLWIKENEGKNVNDFILDYNSKVDRLRELNKTKIGTPANTKGPEWDEFNSLHHKIYPSYGLLSDGRDDWSDKLKDILGESTWRRIPNSFNGLSDLLDKRSAFLMGEDPKWQVAMDNEGHLIVGNTINPNNDIDEHSSTNNDSIADSEGERGTTIESKIKNPFDPTLLAIAGKTLLGLRGNRDIYGNLLKEMPQAPLRDPIDRKLAIVGWQEQIKQGQNLLADLRNIYSKLIGSDALVNLAGALEIEGKGRDITNDKSMKDSGRQFETAGKSWNIDNEDILYNAGVGDANRRSIADRARMMAQIRAAWRSGDNNIKMGAFSDASNWLLKKYQREQDLVDKTKELALGSLESFADWSLRNNPTYKELLAKKQAGTLTEADRAKMLEIRYSIMDDLTNQYAEKFYNLYHTPWFGGGYKPAIVAKDGTKLEIEKLKARGKDNDRYVSMIKDLRQSSRRRRRR